MEVGGLRGFLPEFEPLCAFLGFHASKTFSESSPVPAAPLSSGRSPPNPYGEFAESILGWETREFAD